MSDKELLELVAKAKDDSAAALELAIKFRLNVWHGVWPSGVRYVAAQRIWDALDSCYYDDGVEYGTDPNAATRLAIVRAAIKKAKVEGEV